MKNRSQLPRQSLRFRQFIRRFACARRFGSHLTKSCSAFSETLTTSAIGPKQFRWFEPRSCNPSSRCHSHLLSSTAASSWVLHVHLLRAFGARSRRHSAARNSKFVSSKRHDLFPTHRDHRFPIDRDHCEAPLIHMPNLNVCARRKRLRLSPQWQLCWAFPFFRREIVRIRSHIHVEFGEVGPTAFL